MNFRKCLNRMYGTFSPKHIWSNHPVKPSMITSFPGPVSMQEIERIGKHFDSRHMVTVLDYENCVGSYVSDLDGNMILDGFGQISSIALGYNHPRIQKIYKDSLSMALWGNRSATGMFPPKGLREDIEYLMDYAAPKGMDQFLSMATGSESVENAFKLAMLYTMKKRRNGRIDYTTEELESAMLNQTPGSPNLKILSFSTGFHGRTLGSLSTSRSKSLHKVDIAAFQWPQTPFPQLKYPLNENEEENRLEEHLCLKALRENLENDRDICAVIVEPIQAEGGDKYATPYFFQQIRKITEELDVTFIVDEVQTGGATGQLWAMNYWQLESPADILVFSKKYQSAGIFFNSKYIPSHPYMIFNTWIGDPLRVKQMRAIIEECHDSNLLKNAEQTGNLLLAGLQNFEQRFPQLIHSARGQGLFLAIDCYEEADRQFIIHECKQRGLLLGPSGNSSIRFRPPLVFSPTEAAVTVDILNEVLEIRMAWKLAILAEATMEQRQL